MYSYIFICFKIKSRFINLALMVNYSIQINISTLLEIVLPSGTTKTGQPMTQKKGYSDHGS